jgi:hypothetical protein
VRDEPRRGSRDHLWLLGGAAALAVMVAVAVVVETRGADPGAARKRTAAGAPVEPSATTKGDRTPPGTLLPNMVALPAEELGLGGRGARRVLRFASILANRGAGPLLVFPVRARECPPGQRHVEQRVHLDADLDGAFHPETDRPTLRQPGACMLFHPKHEHWHVDATAAYALTPLDDTAPIVARDKVSFCLRDSEPLRDAAERHRRSFRDCARNRRQGISVGWADRYDASLAGQRLRLPTGLADGDYCLRIEVDPFDLFAESDETDNTSALPVRITGRQVRVAPTAAC